MQYNDEIEIIDLIILKNSILKREPSKWMVLNVHFALKLSNYTSLKQLGLK